MKRPSAIIFSTISNVNRDTKIIMKSDPLHRTVLPSNRIRFFAYTLSERAEFEMAVIAIIVLNVLCMSLKYFDQPKEMDDFLNYSNIAFTALFVLEAAIKLLGYGFKRYFSNRWNMFDAVVVVLSIAGVVIEMILRSNTDDGSGSAVDVPAVSVLRAARIARIFRLVKGVQGLRQLLETLLFSLPSLVNLGSLLLIIFVIYATMGVTFFHNVRWSQDEDDFINSHANFQNFGTAMVTLYRSVTGESWNGIMHYTMRSDPLVACQDYDMLGDGCGSPATGVLFFVSFTLLCTFITLNLFIAIILDNFNTAVANSEAVLPREKLYKFMEVWEKFDPDATEMMSSVLLPQLLMELESPLGVKGKPVTRGSLLQIIKDMHLPIRSGNTVHFFETFHACASRISGVPIPADEFQEQYWSSMQVPCLVYSELAASYFCLRAGTAGSSVWTRAAH